MSITAQDLIDSSLRLLGVLASGETPTTRERDDGLVTLNQLLANWSAQALPVPYLTVETLSLTGAASYTWGAAGDFSTTRPLKVVAASSIASGVHSPLRLLTAAEWAAIPDKTRGGKLAEALYVVSGYPLNTLYLWPTPANGGTLQVHSYKALSAFAALATTVDLPPGYERALRAVLAVELAPEYGAVSKELAEMAIDAKTSIFGLNAAVIGAPAPVAA